MTPTEPPFDLATVDRLLSTTRSVRRRLDLHRPVERSVIERCIELSQQAPTASNSQTWRWIVVTDPALRSAIGDIYRRGLPGITSMAGAADPDDPQTRRAYDGAAWLAEHLGEVPVIVIPCVTGRLPRGSSTTGAASLLGSIYQAVWSFQLALRSRGLGSTFTTLHLLWERDVADVLGIPDDVTQVALLPVAYTDTNGFRPARRPPASTITSWDGWSFD